MTAETLTAAPPEASRKPPTAAEIAGVIAEVESQRNAALGRCAMLAGRNAELLDLVKALQAENANLVSALGQTAPPVAH